MKIEAIRVVQFTDLTPGGPGGGPGGSGQSTAGTVHFAIQEPGVAYLVGFTAVRAGDKWVFSGSEAAASTRTRATDYDGGVESVAPSLAASDPGSGGVTDIEKALVTAYLAVELQKRVMEKAGMSFDINAAKQQAATMGMDPSQFDEALAQGKALSRAKSIMPESGMLVMLFTTMKTLGAGKVTDEQIIQFMSNIISQPEKPIRDILTAAGAYSGGIGGQGVTPRGGGNKPGGG